MVRGLLHHVGHHVKKLPGLVISTTKKGIMRWKKSQAIKPKKGKIYYLDEHGKLHATQPRGIFRTVTFDGKKFVFEGDTKPSKKFAENLKKLNAELEK